MNTQGKKTENEKREKQPLCSTASPCITLGIFPSYKITGHCLRNKKDNQTSKTAELLIQKCTIFEDVMLSAPHNDWYPSDSAFLQIQ
jgi:hypothetical protein